MIKVEFLKNKVKIRLPTITIVVPKKYLIRTNKGVFLYHPLLKQIVPISVIQKYNTPNQ